MKTVMYHSRRFLRSNFLTGQSDILLMLKKKIKAIEGAKKECSLSIMFSLFS